MSDPYEQVAEFHATFHAPTVEAPTAFSAQEASFRAGFKVEEIVEFLAAASQENTEMFKVLVATLKQDIDQASRKILDSGGLKGDPLVNQVDALTDMLYFTYGSFVLMGVDPREIFSYVHAANMGKLFPDGKPHYHEVTGKVLKPANWQQDYAPEARILVELEKQKNDLN